ncbi:MAG TPA: histidine phosphatase family protein [Chloroflexia bacterium]|nr:histidine phosphatase family protein [Chloroflexia bacterium]
MDNSQHERVEQTVLYIVRHTDVHNPADILYGRLPRFRLSDLGLQQAERTAQVLAEEPVAAFYSSPQLRARQTARILSQPHPDARIRITQLLNEVRTAWQGRPHSELEAIRFNFYANPLSDDDERLEQVWERLTHFVRIMRRRHAGESIVGVTHGDLSTLARAGYLRMPIAIESMRLPNVYPGKGSLTRLTFAPDLEETYPISVEYYDPNGDDPRWSQGWVKLPPEGAKV